MTHRLQHKFKMVTITLRYKCKCTNGEVITINVALDEFNFDNREMFLQVVEQAYLDMQTEIRQHVIPG